MATVTFTVKVSVDAINVQPVMQCLKTLRFHTSEHVRIAIPQVNLEVCEHTLCGQGCGGPAHTWR